MARSHYSIAQKSTSTVSAMQLGMSIRKMRNERSLGRVVTCEKSRILPSPMSFWLKSRVPGVAGRAELSDDLATASVRAAELCTVRAPHPDGKGHGQQSSFSGQGPVSPTHVNSFRPLGMAVASG